MKLINKIKWSLLAPLGAITISFAQGSLDVKFTGAISYSDTCEVALFDKNGLYVPSNIISLEQLKPSDAEIQGAVGIKTKFYIGPRDPNLCRSVKSAEITTVGLESSTKGVLRNLSQFGPQNIGVAVRDENDNNVINQTTKYGSLSTPFRVMFNAFMYNLNGIKPIGGEITSSLVFIVSYQEV